MPCLISINLKAERYYKFSPTLLRSFAIFKYLVFSADFWYRRAHFVPPEAQISSILLDVWTLVDKFAVRNRLVVQKQVTLCTSIMVNSLILLSVVSVPSLTSYANLIFLIQTAGNFVNTFSNLAVTFHDQTSNMKQESSKALLALELHHFMQSPFIMFQSRNFKVGT